MQHQTPTNSRNQCAPISEDDNIAHERGNATGSRLFAKEVRPSRPFTLARKRHTFPRMFARLACLLLISILFAACTSSPKSSAEIHAGDGPSIHYHKTENAGGAVETTRYR